MQIIVLILIDLVLLLSSISSTAISIAFPNITTHFNTSLVLAGWVLSIYPLVSACSMVLLGKISDVLGRKNIFLICSGLFAFGSLFAALAPNILLLIAARFIQSIGTGGLFPAIIGIVMEIFPHQRQRVIGWTTSIFPIGAIIGPTIGGWLVTSYGWQSIFWFNVPIILLAVIPLFFLLKSNKRKIVQIDYVGASLFTAFLFAFLISLSQIANSVTNLDWLITGLLFLSGIVCLIMFVKHELKNRNPIIDLELLRLKPFVASNIYNFIIGACTFGFASFIPLYVVSVYGMTTLQSSYILMVRAIGMAVVSMIAGFFLSRLGYRKPMLLGSILMFAGLLLFTFEFAQVKMMGVEVNPVVLISIFALLTGVGMGMANPASTNACLELIPGLASTITGVQSMFRMCGAAISIAVATLVLQFIGNISVGFMVVFLSSALLTLISIPFIFLMPDKGNQSLSIDI